MSQRLNWEQLRDLAITTGEFVLASRRFSADGIDTPGGRLAAGEAAGRVLTPPVLILG